MAASKESFLTVAEYRKRVESDTKDFFRNDPELAKARPVPHPRKPNKIIFSSGAMACVFPVVPAGGGEPRGVKLFFQKIPELAMRYEEIEAALTTLASSHFIEVEYHEGPNGGAVWESYHTPFLKMRFVRGRILKDEVVELVRKHDNQRLLALAQQWQQIALLMEQKQIAHGDLQAENLMVEDSGLIRMIDLDTMFVPSMRPRRLKCVAYGIPSWQHPLKETDESHFDERLDRFPAMAMYLSLLALSQDPGVFNPQMVGENEILFTKNDLYDPHSSRILHRLSGSSNGTIRRVTEALVKAVLGAYDDVPAFSTVADQDAEAKDALQRLKAAISSGDHRSVRDAWSKALDKYPPAQVHRADYTLACKHLEKLEVFCKAADADNDKDLADIWQAAPDLAQCSCSSNEQIANKTSVAERAAQAIQRVQGMEALRRAIEAAEQAKSTTGCYGGSEESRVVAVWNEVQYDLPNSQIAKATHWRRVEEASNRWATFQTLEAAVAADDDELIASIWPTTSSFAPSLVHKARAERAMGRMQVLDDFLGQLGKDPNDDQKLWDIWSRGAGLDMSQCKPASKQTSVKLGKLVPSTRASQAKSRVDALAELKVVFDQLAHPLLSEEGETKLLAAWRQREVVLGSNPAGKPYREAGRTGPAAHKSVEDV